MADTPKQKRRSRYIRPAPIPYRFGSRDERILLTVWKMRYATSEQISLATGIDKRSVEERCQRMWADERRIIDRIHETKSRKIPGSVKAIHVIDNGGLKFVRQLTGLDQVGVSPLENVNSNIHLKHSLLRSHVQALVLWLCRTHPEIELNYWHNEADRYREVVNWQGTDYSVKPDALFSLKFRNQPTGKQDFYFFLEADRSTMKHADMRRKFTGYQALSQKYSNRPMSRFEHTKAFRVLTVIEKKSSEPTRLQYMLDDIYAITAGKGSKLFYFSHKEDMPLASPQQFLNRIWHLALQRPDKNGVPYPIPPQPLFGFWGK